VSSISHEKPLVTLDNEVRIFLPSGVGNTEIEIPLTIFLKLDPATKGGQLGVINYDYEIIDKQTNNVTRNAFGSQVVVVKPVTASDFYELGFKLVLMNSFDEAIPILKEGLALFPDDDGMLKAIARAYYEPALPFRDEVQCSIAKEYEDRAMELYSDDPAVHDGMGNIWLCLGDENKAREEFAKRDELS
jgi:tetratricopeptide (TPR) repeat protein